MRLRSFSFLAVLGLLGAALVLGGCGTHGNAPALGQAARISLKASGASTEAATATLTPMYATHVSTYYEGHALPLNGAQTPAQLRQGSCAGSLVAYLTDGNPTQTARAAGDASLPVAQPDPAGGMDVAVQDSQNLYVVVFDHPNDPNAQVVACGNPLSGQRQYFDLYPPDVGSNGIGRGTALMEPIAVTRVAVTLPAPAPSNGPVTWAVHQGTCDGTQLGSGQIAAGATQGAGVIFRTLDTNSWWVKLTPAGSGSTVCAKA